MKTFIAALALALASQAHAQFSSPERRAVETRVKADLIDPKSAIFPLIIIVDSQVCGYVNYKSAFGEYSGNKPFAGRMVQDVFLLESTGNDATKACKKLGVKI